MDIEKLIETLRQHGVSCVRTYGRYCSICDEAATALSVLQAENEEMQKHLNEFSEFLCRMTGGLLSKTNYTAQEMISASEDYQQKVCGECDLRAENENLRAELENCRKGHCSEGGCAAEKDRDAVLAELEQVKRERDAAVEGLRVCSIENNKECQYCLYRTARSFCWNCTDGSNWKFRGQKED